MEFLEPRLGELVTPPPPLEGPPESPLCAIFTVPASTIFWTDG